MPAKGIEPNAGSCSAAIEAVADQRAVAIKILKAAFAFGLFAGPVPLSATPRELDLHEHSEGSAVTAVRWWLEDEIRPWLSEQPSSAHPNIAHSGRAYHGLWQTPGGMGNG
jgi:hypothetical protein